MPPSYSQNSVATKYYQRRSAETYWLRWLGRVLRMSSEFILDNLLCSELVVGNVRLVDRNKDVCKSDLESLMGGKSLMTIATNAAHQQDALKGR